MSEIFQRLLSRGRGKNKIVTVEKFVAITKDEASKLIQGQRVFFKYMDDRIYQGRVSSVNTWKTKPDVHVTLKYGLKEYIHVHFYQNEMGDTGPFILKQIE